MRKQGEQNGVSASRTHLYTSQFEPKTILEVLGSNTIKPSPLGSLTLYGLPELKMQLVARSATRVPFLNPKL